MNKWMSGLGAAVLASMVWFPSVSLTQDKSLAVAEKAPVELAGLKLDAKVDLPEKAPDPRLTLTAVNAGGETVKKTFKIRLQETRINPMARMMPMPKVVWEQDVELEVAAGKEGRVSIGNPKFASFMTKVEKSDGFKRSTLHELIVECGDEHRTLMSVSIPMEDADPIK